MERDGGKGSEGERLAIDRYSLIRLSSFLFFFLTFFFLKPFFLFVLSTSSEGFFHILF